MTLAGRKPPTTNLLVGHERTRMMHSARKLGAVMGTTPVLVDLEASPPAHTSLGPSMILPPLTISRASGAGNRSSKREGVIFTPRSSTSSIISLEKIDAEPLPPLPLPPVAKLSLSRETRNSLHSVTRLRLVLTLTQPSPSADLYSSTYPYPYPSSSTDSLDTLQRSLSILISSPPPSAPDHAARRRKMVKLVNMLGGPIPPSVVFPPPKPKPQNRTDRAGRRRSRSVPPPTSGPDRPRKLVRPQTTPDTILPALSVDRISHPRPLAAYTPLRSASSSPMSNGTVSSAVSRGRPVTPSYGLRRRGRESTQVSES
ncbi:hypothetical protein B0H12DRAFT_1232916 [Mycena haematopus]|nr:hypothetical protein B0H12DRAFT_1232916 [Mycena haematopus]